MPGMQQMGPGPQQGVQGHLGSIGCGDVRVDITPHLGLKFGLIWWFDVVTIFLSKPPSKA